MYRKEKYMKYSILLSCTMLSIYSTYGAGTPFLTEADASGSGSTETTTASKRYRHDPYSPRFDLDAALALKAEADAKDLESFSTTSTSIWVATSNAFSPTNTATTVQSTLTTPASNENQSTFTHQDIFFKKIEQIKDCLQYSELYLTAVSHIKEIMSVSTLNKADAERLFSLIQDFGNARTDNLRSTKADLVGALLSEYNATCSLFYQLIQSGLFSPSDTDKLRCYLVTFLVGKAFVCGRMGENEYKIEYARDALEVINTITQDVVMHPYDNDSSSFSTQKMREICDRIINGTYDSRGFVEARKHNRRQR
jgi:hypothetical protein